VWHIIFGSEIASLDGELGLGTRASAVGTIGVTRKLEELGRLELEDLLEATSNRKEDLTALFRRATLSTSNISITTAGNALADCPGPNTNSEEGLADVDDNTHNFSIFLVLQGLADRGKHSVEPKLIDVDAALVLEAVRPLATMLVLGILPLGPHTLLEEVVVGLEC
jgi:hypothetical protein